MKIAAGSRLLESDDYMCLYLVTLTFESASTALRRISYFGTIFAGFFATPNLLKVITLEPQVAERFVVGD